MFKKIAIAAAIALSSLTASAAAVFYNSEANFNEAVGVKIKDDFSNPGYADFMNNSAMSSVIGETKYASTYFPDHNFVFDGIYCAGCNGSFLLDFRETSIGDSSGVYGVGLDMVFLSNAYFFITYGNNTTQSFGALNGTKYIGITSSDAIKSIHVGLSNGAPSSFIIAGLDSLTIASAPTAVPEPASLLLAALGLTGVAISRRRKSV